jgi:AcrR family transcriptional regulator
MVKQTQRRSSDDVRDLIVTAAAVEFAGHGYSRTTVRAVAERAGISSSVLHRHFPTKQALFSAAMMAPFVEFFQEFLNAWTEHAATADVEWTDDDLIAEYIRRLFAILKDHRATLLSLAAIGEGSEASMIDQLRFVVADMRGRFAELSERETRGRSLEPGGIRVLNRMIAGLVTGLVLLQPLFTEHRPDEDELLVASAIRFAQRGAGAGD